MKTGQKITVKCHKLKDADFGNQWFEKTLDHWEYQDFKADRRWREGWISFDCALYNDYDKKLYLGITSFDSDIAKAFNTVSGQFEDIGFGTVADVYDAKFHRSLAGSENDGCIYAAIALLHCVDRQWDAPGGAIAKYDPKTGKWTKLGIPIPHTYIQSIALDNERGLIYCQCFPPEYLAVYDIKTGKTRNLALTGTGISGMAQGENIVLDSEGNLWGPWCMTRAWQSEPGADSRRIFRVPAGGERIEFLKTGLPFKDETDPHKSEKYGYARMEGIFNLGDGSIYASGMNGSIYRINTETGRAEYLFTPVNDRPSRLASLTAAADGFAYGVTGREGKCELLKFDFRNDKYELLGSIADKDSGAACWQVHDIVSLPDGRLFACENDNPYRSGYLWEIIIGRS